eukprot:TRINITY_DN2574_c1_g1_i1.p1 TRINITY_DN2574_c1_g1~~TRINITY_DN2574_c1_g1_i1.p1  ORF type:complete len:306 (+),score=157.32 TRINITY_DN2574_c1_g1_i1:409-1326(+)
MATNSSESSTTSPIVSGPVQVTRFQHKMHIGLDVSGVLNCENLTPELEKLLKGTSSGSINNSSSSNSNSSSSNSSTKKSSKNSANNTLKGSADLNLSNSSTNSSATINAIISPRQIPKSSKSGKFRIGSKKKINPKAKILLQQSWQHAPQAIALPNTQKLLEFYDLDGDGFLNEQEAIAYLRDVLEISGQLHQVMIVKPLIKDETDFINQFLKVAFIELDSHSKDGVIDYADLFRLHTDVAKFVRNTIQNNLAELNPSRAADPPSQATDIRKKMMEYEFEETMAGLLDRSTYSKQFKEDKDIYHF